MSNLTRNFRNTVFYLVYRNRGYCLSLYNVLNHTDYTDEDALEIVTLENAICIRMANDAAFVIDGTLNLYEQQSTINPNMPLRDLYYVAEEYKKLVPLKNLYGNILYKIPTPKFMVFYNGAEPFPAVTQYRLSEMFLHPADMPELELVVTTVNINPGYNDDILEQCESLRGYVRFVTKVRDKKRSGKTVEASVTEAVDECIDEGILSEFFKEHKEEVTDMSIWEYDAELHEEVIREESEAKGEARGMVLGRAEGEAKGKIESILEVLRARGNVDGDLSDRIQAQKDISLLNRWLTLAIHASSVEEFRQNM